MANPLDNPFKRLVAEIHRRSLWQVLGIYVVASWGVLSVVDTISGALNLPDWFPSFALALLIIGLPIVVATAFVQEGGPGHRAAADPPNVLPSEVSLPPTAERPVSSRLFTWKKAILGGVGAALLLIGLGVGWVMFGDPEVASSGGPGGQASIEPSVAVMPCTDLSTTQDQGPLAQGLAEGVINSLAQLPELRVSGITSVVALLDRDTDMETIAETLDVATVLECGLQRAGTVIRIGSRLVEAAGGAVLWSEEIEGEAGDIFEIQDRVARAVTDQLQIVLARGDETPLVVQGTTVSEAYEAYARGRFFWNQRTGESLQVAIEEFQRAIELDSEYAEAHSGLADSYAVLDIYAPVTDSRAVRERALEAAERAVGLAPDLGMARTSLAWASFRLGEWENAEREFERAIALSPGYAAALHWYADLLFWTGRAEEAVGVASEAVAADPVSRVVNRALGRALLYSGRVEDGVEQMRRTVELDPNWAAGWLALCFALLDSRAYDEALDAFIERGRLVGADPAITREFIAAAERYAETGEVQAFSFPDDYLLEGISQARAGVYAATGQREGALGVLGRLVEERDYYAVAVSHVPGTTGTLELLGDEPRYQALLEGAGITW